MYCRMPAVLKIRNNGLLSLTVSHVLPFFLTLRIVHHVANFFPNVSYSSRYASVMFFSVNYLSCSSFFFFRIFWNKCRRIAFQLASDAPRLQDLTSASSRAPRVLRGTVTSKINCTCTGVHFPFPRYPQF